MRTRQCIEGGAEPTLHVGVKVPERNGDAKGRVKYDRLYTRNRAYVKCLGKTLYRLTRKRTSAWYARNVGRVIATASENIHSRSLCSFLFRNAN